MRLPPQIWFNISRAHLENIQFSEQGVGRSMTLTYPAASELSQLIEGTSAATLIPEIVQRGFQERLEGEDSAATGAQLHERCQPSKPPTPTTTAGGC
jgi:hypothetical protein